MKRLGLERLLILIGCVIIFLAIVSVPVVTALEYNHKETHVGTVTDKYNKRSEKSDKFYIVLDDKKVIMNTDLIFKGYFDSADKQAHLRVGDKVKVTTIGFRIPFLSMYPKVYEIERVD